MEDEELDNDFLVDNFQEEIKDSQIFKSESGNDEKSPDYNEINDDILQYSTNKNESPPKNYSKFENKQNIFQINYSNKKNNTNNLNYNYTNENYFLESPHKQNNFNLNEDISGISLLKELEDQWNSIEKQKMNYYNKNKEDESTNNNTKNNINYEKFKYIKDMVECKKNKFLSIRQKAKNIRDNDQEIEQFFLIKFKEMEKYKIMDNNLKKKIEIRQQEKIYEDRMNQINIKNNNDDKEYDDITQNYENENNQQERKNNLLNKKSFLQNDVEEVYNNKNNYFPQQNHQDIFYVNNENPELDDLIYETPARSNNFDNEEIIENIKNNKDYKDYTYNLNYNYNVNNEEIQNKDNNLNLDIINKSEKNKVSVKLVEKMKNLFNEINNKENQNNKFEQIINKNNNYNNDKNSKLESGVLGINNINNYKNNILTNIRNANSHRIDNNKINDANKSINLNFNYNNYSNNNNNNIKYENLNSSNTKNSSQYSQYLQKYLYNNQNHSINQSDISINKDKDINKYIQNDYNNNNNNNNKTGLSCLQQNFDSIMKQIKSGGSISNTNKSNKNQKKFKLFENENNRFIKEENNESQELDKYFEELSKEAILKVKQNKGYDKPSLQNKYQENKIKIKIEENSDMLNKFLNEMNHNKNKFKQRMIALNNNLNNIKIDKINDSYQREQLYGNNTNRHQRSLSGFKISSIYSNHSFNNK